MTKLYNLPHGFYVTEDNIPGESNGFNLWCNGKFVYWNESLDRVFIVFGRHLETVRG